VTAAVRRLGSGGPWEDTVGYSRAVVTGGRVLFSGTTAVVDGVLRHPGDAYRQALVAFDAVAAVLGAAGTAMDLVVRSRMYVVDRADADGVGRAHAERLGAARPAATLVVVAGLLDPRMLVEVEVEAVLPDPGAQVARP
jgi:enamine deaminase RidA (YjgF/YER057c/UK114 family)